MTKKFTYTEPKVPVKCSICGEVEYREYDFNVYQLDEICPVCLPVKQTNPQVFDWVMRVIKKHSLTKSDIQDIVEDRLNPPGYY